MLIMHINPPFPPWPIKGGPKTGLCLRRGRRASDEVRRPLEGVFPSKLIWPIPRLKHKLATGTCPEYVTIASSRGQSFLSENENAQDCFGILFAALS